MASLFPAFEFSDNYPALSNNVQVPGPPYQTNSWAQNMFKGTVAPYQNGMWTPFNPVGSIKSTPWNVQSPGGGNMFFTHSDVATIIHGFIEGNNTISQGLNNDESSINFNFIKLTLEGRAPTTTKLTDYKTSSFTLETVATNPERRIETYVVRGSPFVAMRRTSGTETVFFTFDFVGSWVITGITNVPNIKSIVEVYNRNKETISKGTFTSNINGTLETQLSYFNEYTFVSFFTLNGFSFNESVPVSGIIYIRDSSIKLGEFVNSIFIPRSPNVSQVGNDIVWTPGGEGSYIITISFGLTNNNRNLITISNILPANDIPKHKLTIYYSPGMTITSTSTKRFELGSDNVGDTIRFCLDDGDAIDSDDPPYATSLNQEILIDTPNGNYNLDYTSNFSINDIYLYKPKSWFAYNIVATETPLGKTINDTVYGECVLTKYVTTNKSLAFQLKTPIPLPTQPNLNTIANSKNLRALTSTVIFDIVNVYKKFTSNSYSTMTINQYGPNAAKYGRILMYASQIGLIDDDVNVDYYETFEQSLLSWLNGTNGCAIAALPTDSNQIKYESSYGGLITSFDYYLQIRDGNINLRNSNSFYNMQHIQYGYLIYAIYARCISVDKPWLTNDQYRKIIEIMRTYIGYTDFDPLFVKSRCKDWYFGHSYSTGLISEFNINQWTVGEAINAYYAAYLMSKYINELSGMPSDIALAARFLVQSSSAALQSEVIASKAYWTNIDNQVYLATQSMTTLSMFSRGYSSPEPSSPTSFSSRAVHNYASITYPFTDISLDTLDIDWVARYSSNQTYEWQRVDQEVIADLCNYDTYNWKGSWAYKPINSPYNIDLSTDPVGTTSWGLTGSLALVLSGLEQFGIQSDVRYLSKVKRYVMDVTNGVTLVDGAGNIDSTVLNDFDSISNSYYIWHYLANRNLLAPVDTVSDGSNTIQSDAERLTPELAIVDQSSLQNRSALFGKAQPARNLLGDFGNMTSNRLKSNKCTLNNYILNNDKFHWSRDNTMRVWDLNRILGDPCSPVAAYQEVPTIHIIVNTDLNSGDDVSEVIYEVSDAISYDNNQPYNPHRNCISRMIPKSEVIITTFRLNADEANIKPVLNTQAATLFEAAQNLGPPNEYLSLYSYARLILSKLLYGDFNINYLRRQYTAKFMRDLAKTRFNLFLELFTSNNLTDFNGTTYSLIGYGGIQQGQTPYFIE